MVLLRYHWGTLCWPCVPFWPRGDSNIVALRIYTTHERPYALKVTCGARHAPRRSIYIYIYTPVYYTRDFAPILWWGGLFEFLWFCSNLCYAVLFSMNLCDCVCLYVLVLYVILVSLTFCVVLWFCFILSIRSLLS